MKKGPCNAQSLYPMESKTTPEGGLGAGAVGPSTWGQSPLGSSFSLSLCLPALAGYSASHALRRLLCPLSPVPGSRVSFLRGIGFASRTVFELTASDTPFALAIRLSNFQVVYSSGVSGRASSSDSCPNKKHYDTLWCPAQLIFPFRT